MVEGITGDENKLELVIDPAAYRPGVMIYTGSGRALRFVREAPGVYRSLRRALPFEGFQRGVETEWWPRLRILSPTRMAIDGLGRELAAVTSHPPPSESSLDDVSVRLSKAVNIASNYVGYNISTMDPVHLVRTGVDGMIFAQPEPGSQDYADQNRVFVPGGLIYTPIFSGSSNVSTEEVTTIQNFSKAVSRTVGSKWRYPCVVFFRQCNDETGP